MSASIFRSLIRRPSAATASMLHPRLMGSLTPQVNLPKNAARLPQEDLATNVKFVTSFTLQGLKSSEIQNVFSLMKQHINADGANKALLKYTTSPTPLNEKVSVRCRNEATFIGFSNSEMETLHSSALKYTETAIDLNAEKGYNKKILLDVDCYTKGVETQARHKPFIVGCKTKSTLDSIEGFELETEGLSTTLDCVEDSGLSPLPK